MSEHTDYPKVAPVCEHYWAWVSPSGALNFARICQLCHQPDAEWLNHIIEIQPDDCKIGKTCGYCEITRELTNIQPIQKEEL